MEKGRVVHSPLFLVRLLPQAASSGGAKFAAIASKKVAKTAVGRNKIRRQTYESIAEVMKVAQANGKTLLAAHVAVFAKDAVVKAEFEALVSDLSQLFVKAGIIK